MRSVRRPPSTTANQTLVSTGFALVLLLGSAAWTRFSPDGAASLPAASMVSAVEVAAAEAESPPAVIHQLGAYLTVIDDINLEAEGELLFGYLRSRSVRP